MIQFRKLVSKLAKPYSISRRHFQVSIVGGARPLGQTISLLLKQHPLIQRLNMIDNQEEINGVAIDVSHIPQQAAVSGWKDKLEEPLYNSDIVVVANGEHRKAGQDDVRLFNENAEGIISIMQTIGSQCPKAFVIIATEPIDRIVPLASKVLEHTGFENKNKIIGVTGQDTMRAQCWLGEASGLNPNTIKIPIICGHSSRTIVPLFSHLTPKMDISDSTAATIMQQLRKAEDYIAGMKHYCGNYSLVSAYATSSTVSAVLNALNGIEKQHIGFISHDLYGTKFFSTPMLITSGGVFGLMQRYVTPHETSLIANASGHLAREVSEGEAYFNPASSFSQKHLYQRVLEMPICKKHFYQEVFKNVMPKIFLSK